MAEWREEDHPRDDTGRFTFSGGGGGNTSSAEDDLQKRADILFDNTEYKPNGITGGAASIVLDEISGVKKGEPMTIEDAINGVNPNYDIFGNPTYKTNCQAGVAIFEARLRGFDVETDISLGGDLKDKLEERPNIAYIDPATGKTPEFTTIKAKNEFDCINYLDQKVQEGERYVFAFIWKNSSNKNKIGHVVTVTKDSNNNLVFYDPQIKESGIMNGGKNLSLLKYLEWMIKNLIKKY